MAVQDINFNPKPEKGISYSKITDNSGDWASVPVSTYFYDLATNLPYYKDANDTVVSIFGAGTPDLTNGQIFVGNASNAATSVAMSGDTTISNTGVVTIGSDKVTYDKMQDVTQAAMLGNSLTVGGTVEEIPIVQQYLTTGANTALLNDTNNWDVNGEYKTTSTSLTGTFQGQAHYNGDYWFTAVDDNVWIRLIRG